MTGVLASLASRAAGLPFAAERVTLQPRPLARFEGLADIAADGPPAIAELAPLARSPDTELRSEPASLEPVIEATGSPAAAPQAASAPPGSEKAGDRLSPREPARAPSLVSPAPEDGLATRGGGAKSTSRLETQPGDRPKDGPAATASSENVVPARQPKELRSPPSPTTVVEFRPTGPIEPSPSPVAPVTVTIGRIVVEQASPLPVPARPSAPARTAGFDAYAAQRRGRLR